LTDKQGGIEKPYIYNSLLEEDPFVKDVNEEEKKEGEEDKGET
jgi:hypothetical protein